MRLDFFNPSLPRRVTAGLRERYPVPVIAMSNSTTSSWVPHNNMSSAHVGEPPNTQRDWYIVRGLLRVVGMGDTDPANGYVVAVTASETGQDYTSKRPAVIAGLIVVLVAITVVTGSRLALRASMSQMRFGADDWATIAAAVCLRGPRRRGPRRRTSPGPNADFLGVFQAMALTYTTCQLIMAIKGGGDHIVCSPTHIHKSPLKPAALESRRMSN